MQHPKASVDGEDGGDSDDAVEKMAKPDVLVGTVLVVVEIDRGNHHGWEPQCLDERRDGNGPSHRSHTHRGDVSHFGDGFDEAPGHRVVGLRAKRVRPGTSTLYPDDAPMGGARGVIGVVIHDVIALGPNVPHYLLVHRIGVRLLDETHVDRSDGLIRNDSPGFAAHPGASKPPDVQGRVLNRLLKRRAPSCAKTRPF